MRHLVLLSILLSLLCFTAPAHAQARPAREGAGHAGLLKAIVVKMDGEGASVVDPRYDRFFRQGAAAKGVADILAAGRFFINGYAIPGSAEAFRRDCPSGYLVNQLPWLAYDAASATWKGGIKAERPAASYSEAALAVATGIVPGLEVRLVDEDGDGFTDRVDADYKEGVLADRIVRQRDGSVRVVRDDPGVTARTAAEGRIFDGQHFTANSDERIAAKNFDPSIKPHDVVLFWYGKSGWAMQRAIEARGPFLGGVDHQNYNIGGKVFQDAMRFSRDNLSVSNRPGEYANAHVYFGLDKQTNALPTSIWLVPTTDPAKQGAPIALTSGSHARAFLRKAIAHATDRLHSAVVSTDGNDVPVGRNWVTKAAHDELGAVIRRAEAKARAPASPSVVLDYQIYLLYLALNGSDGDIGAKFGNFHYAGFENAVKAGRMPN